MSYSLDKIKEYKRQILRELYDDLSEGQQNVFKRMYVSIDDIADEKIDWAIQQCERTLSKTKFNFFNDK